MGGEFICPASHCFLNLTGRPLPLLLYQKAMALLELNSTHSPPSEDLSYDPSMVGFSSILPPLKIGNLFLSVLRGHPPDPPNTLDKIKVLPESDQPTITLLSRRTLEHGSVRIFIQSRGRATPLLPITSRAPYLPIGLNLFFFLPFQI